jgi:hypothetical protein
VTAPGKVTWRRAPPARYILCRRMSIRIDRPVPIQSRRQEP